MSIQCDPQEVEKTLHLICRGQLTEIRALNASLDNGKYRGVAFGYFDDYAKAAREIARIASASGVYFMPNPVRPELLARANNRLVMGGNGHSPAGDADILERRWLMIDIDPERPSGISATDAQKEEAKAVASAVYGHLVNERGFPLPVCADSGNGYHLLFALEEPVADSEPFRAILHALAGRFDTPGAKIDLSVFNAGRIWKLYGTMACKGDPVPGLGIVHRMARLLQVPDAINPLGTAKLQALAALAPSPATGPTPLPGPGSGPIQASNAFDWLDQWIARHFPEAGTPEPWGKLPGGRIWKIDCPWQPHHGPKACITQQPGGAIAAKCFKGSCHDHGWHSLRDLKEPGWRGNEPDEAEPWPEPVPLRAHSVAPLDGLLIPEPLRAFLLDIALRMQVPLDFPAVSLITAFGSLIGRKAVVFPKGKDTWFVPANLWAVLIGPPGIKKTPAVQAVMGYLYDAQAKANQDYEPLERQYQSDLKRQETAIRAATKQLETAIAKGSAAAQAQAVQSLDSLHQNPPKKPPLRRFYVQDATVEKLQEIMGENPNGTLLLRDELIAFLRSLDKAGRESDRGFFLESWNGNGGITVDRIGRGTHFIPHVCLSLIGTIQPGVLREYIQRSLEGGCGADGLVQRFQLAVYPVNAPYEDHDVWPDRKARQQVEDLMERVGQFNPGQGFGAGAFLRQEGEHTGYGFSPEAQAHFDGWYTALQNRLRDGSLPHEAIMEHLSKYGSLMPKLALVFHILDVVSGRLSGTAQYSIQTESALRAIAWCEYLETHAFRIYGIEKNGAQSGIAHKLLDKMKSGLLGTGFALWELEQKGWGGLKDRKEIQKAVDLLEDHGWVRLQRNKDTKGRPSEKVIIHPRIRETGPEDGGDTPYPTVCLERLRNHLANLPDEPLDGGLADEHPLEEADPFNGSDPFAHSGQCLPDECVSFV